MVDLIIERQKEKELYRINAFTAMNLWLEDRYVELRKDVDELKESKQ